MRCSALIVLVASLAAGASTLAAALAKNECKTFGFFDEHMCKVEAEVCWRVKRES
jgi:hypothetical protein